MARAPIFNPLPVSVVVLAAVMFGIEVLFNLADRGIIGGPAAIGWRSEAIRNHAFFGQALDWMIVNRRTPPELLLRFVSYPLIHLGFTQMLFAVVFVLAMGKMVGEAMGEAAVWVLFFAGSIVGAAAYGLLLNDPYPLAGGFPGAYALIGGFTYLLWLRQKLLGERQLVAFRLIGFLMAIQLLFGLLFGGTGAWLADGMGFVAGFLLSSLFVPGGMARLRARLRGR